SITGIDFDEKLDNEDYWPLKEQQLMTASSNSRAIQRNERMSNATTSVADLSKTTNNKDTSARGQQSEHISHL
ncbi:unnamed protein product, partial [Rotaria magnacalcarata]